MSARHDLDTGPFTRGRSHDRPVDATTRTPSPIRGHGEEDDNINRWAG